MNVLILGGGLLGVSTAYVLASRGHAVTLVERQAGCGAETSFANGGQLSYSHAEPWATPHVLTKLPKWLVHADSPLIFRPRLDIDMIRWGLSFLRNCTPARAEENCINALRLGLYSRLKLEEIMRGAPISFDYSARGILHIFGSEGELEHAKRQAEFQSRFGCEERILTRSQALDLEPTLAHGNRPLAGGIHAHMDASGDAHAFCLALMKHCVEKLGVTLHCNTRVDRLEASMDRIRVVHTSRGSLEADAVVMALGSYSPQLLKPLGVRIPVYPMKGYSITVPAGLHAPSVSITDGSFKIVFSRLGDKLRVAGTAEFAGYDTTVRPERIAPILRGASGLFPRVEWENRSEWACLRPSTPRGTPLLGRTALYSNLFLNTGHGTLGWTQAPGSAFIVADQVEGRPPEITLAGLTADVA